MDRETFDTMWEMSKNEAEGCFLQLPQVEYYAEAREGSNALEVMPNVRPTLYHMADIMVLIFKSSSSGT